MEGDGHGPCSHARCAYAWPARLCIARAHHARFAGLVAAGAADAPLAATAVSMVVRMPLVPASGCTNATLAAKGCSAPGKTRSLRRRARRRLFLGSMPFTAESSTWGNGTHRRENARGQRQSA